MQDGSVSVGTVQASIGLDLAPLESGTRRAGKLLSGLTEQMEGLGKVKFADPIEKQLGGIGDMVKIVTGDVGELGGALKDIKFNASSITDGTRTAGGSLNGLRDTLTDLRLSFDNPVKFDPLGITDGAKEAQGSLVSLQGTFDSLKFDSAPLTASIGLVTKELKELIAQADLAKGSLGGLGLGAGIPIGPPSSPGPSPRRNTGSSAADARVNIMDRLGNAAMTTGEVGAGIIAATTLSAAGVQKAYLDMKSNSGMSTADAQKYKAWSLDFAAKTGADIKSLFDSFMWVTDHKFTGKDAITVVRAAAKSAVDTGGDPAQFSTVVGQALHIFHAPASQAGNYASALHYSAQAGSMTVPQLFDTIGPLNAAAAQANIPLKDVLATFTAMTQNGYNAAKSVTQLVNIITGIQHPTAQAEKHLKALEQATGVPLTKAFSYDGIQKYGFPKILQMVQEATQGHPDVGYNLINAKRGGLGMGILTDKGSADITHAMGPLTAAFAGKNDTITAGFNERINSTDNLFAAFVNHLKKISDELGQDVLPRANQFLGFLDGLVTRFDKLPKGVKSNAVNVGMAATVGALGLGVVGRAVKLGLGVVGRAVKPAYGFWKLMGKAGGTGLLARMGTGLFGGGGGLGAAGLLGRLGLTSGTGLYAGRAGTAALGGNLLGGGLLAAPALALGYGAYKINQQHIAQLDAEQRGAAMPELAPFIQHLSRLRQELKQEPGNAKLLEQIRETKAALRAASGVSASGPVKHGTPLTEAMAKHIGEATGVQCGQAVSNALKSVGITTPVSTLAKSAIGSGSLLRPNSAGHLPPGTLVFFPGKQGTRSIGNDPSEHFGMMGGIAANGRQPVLESTTAGGNGRHYRGDRSLSQIAAEHRGYCAFSPHQSSARYASHVGGGQNLPAPSVNLPAPSVNLPAPSVNLPAPSVNLPAPSVRADWYKTYESLTNPDAIKAAKLLAKQAKVAAHIDVLDSRAATLAPMSKYDQQRMKAVFAYQDNIQKPGVNRTQAWAATEGELKAIDQKQDADLKKHEDEVKNHLDKIKKTFADFVAGLKGMTAAALGKTATATKAPDALALVRDAKIKAFQADHTNQLATIAGDVKSGAATPQQGAEAITLAQTALTSRTKSAWDTYNVTVAAEAAKAAHNVEALQKRIADVSLKANAHVWRQADAEAMAYFQELRSRAEQVRAQTDTDIDRLKKDGTFAVADPNTRAAMHQANQSGYTRSLGDIDMQESDAAKQRKIEGLRAAYDAAQDTYSKDDNKQAFANTLGDLRSQVPEDAGLPGAALGKNLDVELKRLGKDGKATTSELGRNIADALGHGFDEAMGHAKHFGSFWKELMGSMKVDTKQLLLSFASKEFKSGILSLFSHKEKGVTPQGAAGAGGGNPLGLLAGLLGGSKGKAQAPSAPGGLPNFGSTPSGGGGGSMFGGPVSGASLGKDPGMSANPLPGGSFGSGGLSSLGSLASAAPGGAGIGSALNIASMFSKGGMLGSVLGHGGLRGLFAHGGLFTSGGSLGGLGAAMPWLAGGLLAYSLFKKPLKKLFHFADGGHPPVGVPSLVGERGPELFVPNHAGTIIPNHMLGGNHEQQKAQANGLHITVNHHGDVYGHEGKQSAASDMAWLIKQQLPVATPGT